MSSGKLVILNHPLIHHKLALIRDGTEQRRQTVSEIERLWLVTRELPNGTAKTPVVLQRHKHLLRK